MGGAVRGLDIVSMNSQISAEMMRMQLAQRQGLQNLYGAQQQSGLMDMLGGGGVPAPPQQLPEPDAYWQAHMDRYKAIESSKQPLQLRTSTPTPKKELSMFKTVASDVKSFILEHRSTLYFLAFALLVDHFLFQDAFRNRLKAIADGLIKKVEDKVAQS